jgi:hypothetical protein
MLRSLSNVTKNPRLCFVLVLVVVVACAVMNILPFLYNSGHEQHSKSPKTTANVVRVNFPPSSSIFPREPKITPGCSVKFQHTNMSLCYFVQDGATFGDELGPAAVKRILEYHHGCSAADIHVIDIAHAAEKINERTCLFTRGSAFHSLRAGDHVWGTGMNPAHHGFRPKRLRFHSVRGKETERNMKECYKYDSIPNGDPGTSMRRST